MTKTVQSEQLQLPTRKNILISTALAALIAAAILVTIVLPVEYGIDLTGVGHGLGLSAIAAAKTRPAPAAMRQLQQVSQASAGTEQYAHSTDTPFRTETIEIPMQGDEELEYKFQMQKGQMLMYSWNSGATQMYYEFHAEPTEGEYPEDYYMSYQIGDGSTAGNGTLIAPFTGRHGWYFLNLTEHPVTVKFEVSGYYASHGRLGREGESD